MVSGLQPIGVDRVDDVHRYGLRDFLHQPHAVVEVAADLDNH